MCDECRQFTCPPQCPNYNPKKVAVCAECGEDIYNGDECYKLLDEYICADCVKRAKTVAEVEE